MGTTSASEFETQAAGQQALNLMVPGGEAINRRVNPQFTESLLDGLDPATRARYMRFTGERDAFGTAAAIGEASGRGVTEAEQAILGGSLSGLTAPLDLSRYDQARDRSQGFLNSLIPGQAGGPQLRGVSHAGGPQQGGGGQPSGQANLPYNPATASGLSFTPGQGTVSQFGNPQLVMHDPTPGDPGDKQLDQYYLNNEPVSQAIAQRFMALGPNDQADFPGATTSGSGFGNLTQDVFASLGGQMQVPGAPNIGPAPTLGNLDIGQAPTLGNLDIGQAPELGEFSVDTADISQRALQGLMGTVPGVAGALERGMDPNIALPEQTILNMVAAERAGGGPMDQYVEQANQGVQQALDRRLAEQVAANNSRFAAEGSFLSGPSLNATGQLQAASNAELAGILGPLNLQAANAESDRLFAAAGRQYETEFDRNLRQAQTGAATASNVFGTLGSIAQGAGSAQSAALANAYGTQGQFLANRFNTQADAAASAYGTRAAHQANIFGTQADAATRAHGTQGQFLSNIYGTQARSAQDTFNTQMQAASAQQNLAATQALQRAQMIQQGLGGQQDMARQRAFDEQTAQQQYLSALGVAQDAPGQNLIDALGPALRIPPRARENSSFGDFLQGISGGLGAAAGGAMAGCWVAAELYGWFSDKWHRARRFIFEKWEGKEADAFRAAYVKNGPRWAALVRRDPDLRAQVQVFFDLAVAADRMVLDDGK
jgi:hypothetical protein